MIMKECQNNDSKAKKEKKEREKKKKSDDSFIMGAIRQPWSKK